jgi:hypothetical protein
MQNLVTKNQFIYSDRKNTEYKSEEVINVFVPPNMAMVNTKEVFMVFDVKLSSSQYKGCLCPSAGAYSLFRNIQIMDGTGSTVLETLDSYATLQALKYHMEKLDSTENLYALHEGKPNKNVLNQNDSSLNQYCDATKAEDYYTTVKVTLPLYCSGLLNPNRKYLTPVLALRGLRIQIELNNFVDMFQATTAPLYKYVANNPVVNQLTGAYGVYSDASGYMCQATANIGATEITLMKYGDYSVVGDNSVVLTDDRLNPAHLFCVGQKIKVEGHNDAITVNGVKIVANRVVLTVDALTFAVHKNEYIYIDSEITDGDVIISNFALNVGTVDPPQDYLNEIMKLTNTGKLQFDITSYTLFNKNISKDSLSNSLVINAMNRRAKSLLCIPIMSKHDVLVDTFQSIVDSNNQLQSYSLKLYNNVIVPDRVVPLTNYNDGKFNAICQREQMLSVQSAGFDVNNIKDMHQHFFIGRRLAMKGYSYDCKGSIELNINYKQNADAFVMGCFVVHKRAIIVNDNNVSVVF